MLYMGAYKAQVGWIAGLDYNGIVINSILKGLRAYDAPTRP